jgi:AcrR family transcriptional regulator
MLETKQLIARTALRLFVEKGMTETTIRDLAGAAGIAEGTLYRHYASKEDLAWELFHTNFTAFAGELEQVQSEHRDARSKIDALVRHFCRSFDQDWVLFSYLLLSQHGQLKRVTPEMPNPVKVVREVIAAAMARGEIRKRDPDFCTALMLGPLLQTATFKIYGRIDAAMIDLADELSAACWRVLEQ